ncbi:hypothetical protein [Palaeococcus ferrophilus]|uniref:hypothetical protein n=1 Tax=Palaeococcus ferrophilus TaxID=83868 RepID=UPI00064E61E4|nr:hypothetical protein [Palaeococcus ferrophilus]
MGHTLYYTTRVEKWGEFKEFLQRVCEGVGYFFEVSGECVTVTPDCPLVEPLRIPRDGEGFAKTNLVEPCHSIYLLVLHSVSSFGSVEVWEDS